MIKVTFKNLERSDIAENATIERLDDLIEKFPDLFGSKILVTVSMENSTSRSASEKFRIKILCTTGRYKDVVVEKSGPHFYKALADAVDHMLERLNRFGDRTRVENIKAARNIVDEIINITQTTSNNLEQT
jgi:ribosome-associated translation inhibitor RaiA